MPDVLTPLRRAALARQGAGLRRVLVPRSADDGRLDLAGNDYLGLSRHRQVVEAAATAARRFGAGATGSRLVSGTTVLHEQLEHTLAAHVGAPSALVFSSGYLANLGAVTALARPGGLVVSDARNHASLIDACRLSRARVEVVPPGDVRAVSRLLAGRRGEPALVVTDAVFSVDGALAPLPALHAAARAAGALLVVDDAHGLGVVGDRGQGAAAALAGEPDVVITVSLSKALGSQGGAVLGPPEVREHLVNTARPFVFDTGLAPACVGAALAALRLVTRDRVAALRAAVDALARALEVPAQAGAVLRVPLGDAAAAVDARDRCLADGVRVGCFRPPSVPDGQSCLRITARADLRDEDVELAAKVVNAAR